jgi:hypothetical protein
MADWIRDLFGAFGKAVGQSFDSAAPAQVRDQLMQWVGHLSTNALRAWGPNMLAPDTCEFCSQVALGECIVCGASCCLAHAHVSYRAELICDECVGSMVGSKPDQKRARAQERFRKRAERATRAPDADQRIVAALGELGLKPGASWDDIKSEYRLLAAKYHPDKARSAARREALEEKLKRLNAAYALLKAHYERAA